MTSLPAVAALEAAATSGASTGTAACRAIARVMSASSDRAHAAAPRFRRVQNPGAHLKHLVATLAAERKRPDGQRAHVLAELLCDPAAHLSTHAVAPRGALASLPPPHGTQPEAAWILPIAHGAQ